MLSKATAYAERYATRAVSTVSEERYVQAIVDSPIIDRRVALAWRENPDESRKRTPGVALRRQIAADMLMVKSNAGYLVPYRDVAAVDGRPVKDRDTRAMQLFTSGGAPSTATLRRITEEGARYNLGNVRRTVNVPTMALLVLDPRHVGRFEFETGGHRARRRRRRRRWCASARSAARRSSTPAAATTSSRSAACGSRPTAACGSRRSTSRSARAASASASR